MGLLFAAPSAAPLTFAAQALASVLMDLAPTTEAFSPMSVRTSDSAFLVDVGAIIRTGAQFDWSDVGLAEAGLRAAFLLKAAL